MLGSIGSQIGGVLGRQQVGLQRIYERLSTGVAVNRAADGPSVLAMAKELEKQVRGFRQSSSNLGDAMSALKIAEGTGSEVSSMLQRQRELALQANNGTLNKNDKSALQQEYKALSEEIQRISRASQYNGQNLAAGGSKLSDGTGQVQGGNRPEDARTLGLVDYTSVVDNSIDLSDPAGAMKALKAADQGLKDITATRTQIGSQTNAMEFASSNLSTQEINTTDALTRMADLDMAQGLAEKARAELLGRSGYQSMSAFQDMARQQVQGLLK
jgi:flagellin